MGETRYHRKAIMDASDLGLRAGQWPETVIWEHRQWVRAAPKHDTEGDLLSVRYVSNLGDLDYIELVND